MNFYKKYFDTALKLIANYNGNAPLSIYLKKHFALHKKYGSKDRKQVTHLCYCYYRLGFALTNLSPDKRLLAALFLCNDKSGEWLYLYDDLWQNNYDEDLNKRIAFIQSVYPFSIENIFFKPDEISDEINKPAFAKAHLIQPDLFIRIRPGKKNDVIKKLIAKEIAYKSISDDCIALDNTTKIDEILELNKEAVVQDFSSQRIAEFLKLAAAKCSISTVWDCCAASGGKAILAADILPEIQLTVSDIRPAILQNLQKRFAEAGIHQYKTFIADLTNNISTNTKYDLVICDAPCSGSGTWARTPEQLYFIAEEKIKYYAALQKKIVQNAAKAVKKQGCFLYITCSVYTAENEAIVDFICEKTSLQLIKAELLQGYELKADTMFAALFYQP